MFGVGHRGFDVIFIEIYVEIFEFVAAVKYIFEAPILTLVEVDIDFLKKTVDFIKLILADLLKLLL